jgi:hypothetical protein
MESRNVYYPVAVFAAESARLHGLTQRVQDRLNQLCTSALALRPV